MTEESIDKIQKRGRPKKYNFADTSISKEEYNRKWYESHKDQISKKYEGRKDEIKQKYNDNNEHRQKSKELQSKYRESYRILKMLYENGNIPDDVIEKTKKIFE
jgi:hypothetical protein